MALRTHDLSALRDYLPEGTMEDVIAYMHLYKIHLILRKDRKSILGDYRAPYKGQPHTISLNISLNKYHFLITFIHELAHLVNYTQYQNRVQPHGKEWKNNFAVLLKHFSAKQIFPDDIEKAIRLSVNNLSASTCSDPNLFKALQKYDANKAHLHLVESLQTGDFFRTPDGKHFKIIGKRRTRYTCEEVSTKKMYLFPGIYEVIKD